MKKIAPLLCAALAACAQTYWVHPNKQSQAFYQDSTECLQVARASAAQPAFIPEPAVQIGGRPSVAESYQRGAIRSQNQTAAENAERERRMLYDHCLRGRGWYTVTK